MVGTSDSSPAVVFTTESYTMPRKAKKPKESTPTKNMRLHCDVAELIDELAPIFGASAPTFASDLLRPLLEAKIDEATQKLQSKKIAMRKGNGHG